MSTGYKVLGVILGVLMVAGGIYCMVTPGLTFLTIGWVLGASMIADAIGAVIGMTIVAAGANLITTACSA